ncbi:MAG: VTT domain-containing protein [Clostridia bacterium]|nr:VTT domain-containing protein [Clostridia bacterium]
MEKTKKRKITERIVILCIALVVLCLLVFFLRNIFFPFIKLEAKQDFEGAKQLLLDNGVIGFLTVSLIEALQMVVIFIPAEFIQLSSGMSYPWWLAMILCDLGVALGCSMIYFLVNVFRFNGDIFNKEDKIKKYEQRSKTRNTMIFMYILFIMPIIPFGAICYYGSSKKIPYRKYLLTCATGVIPSIATSILMGSAIKKFIADALPIWALILIIVLAAAILFSLLVLVLKKFFFKDEEGYTPFLISLFEKLALKILSLKIRFKVTGAEAVREMTGPFIYLAEHHSALDVAALYRIDTEKDMAGVINEYIFRTPLLGKMMRKSSHISKKMFYPDVMCLKGIMRAIKKGRPVAIMPEARLSTDGGPSYVDKNIADLCKKLGVPVVIVEIRNLYFISPKWRKKIFRGVCEVEVKRIIQPEELKELDGEELAGIIRQGLSYNEFSRTICNFRSRKKAEGLHNVLYMCPHCKTLYSNTSKGNTLTCTHCGKQYHIGADYRFTETDLPTIFDYYAKIKEIEKETLHDISLDIPVDVKIFKDRVKEVRTEKGVFHLDSQKVSFKSDISDLYFEYTVDHLEGIAYSCGDEFELYYKDELYYFYPPEGQRQVCTRVALLYEMLRGELENA